MRKSARVLAAAVAVTSLGLAGCSGDTGDAGGDGPWTIGLSNAFIGSEYRTQMVADVEEVFAEYKAEGLVDELVLENADTDTNGQIQQIRNLINKGSTRSSSTRPRRPPSTRSSRRPPTGASSSSPSTRPSPSRASPTS